MLSDIRKLATYAIAHLMFYGRYSIIVVPDCPTQNIISDVLLLQGYTKESPTVKVLCDTCSLVSFVY